MGFGFGARTTIGLSWYVLDSGTNFYCLPITYYSTHGFLYNLLLATDYLLFRAYRWNFNEEPFILVFIKLKTLKQPWATQPWNTSICHFPQLSTTIHNHNNPQLRTITSSYNLMKQSTIDHVFVWGTGARRIRGNIDLRNCLFMSHQSHPQRILDSSVIISVSIIVFVSLSRWIYVNVKLFAWRDPSKRINVAGT